ncbi:hypothetical protein WH47_11352 [Habropoda laboriosa]|uniref:Uncharacterized protein n=1 Tax=Habropoda laboriosa TaxID=597456 RepID=A0A0L7QLX5_9HYME|nr:hypothetical protein WH47_11352 [Habropoda laboriosa]
MRTTPITSKSVDGRARWSSMREIIIANRLKETELNREKIRCLGVFRRTRLIRRFDPDRRAHFDNRLSIHISSSLKNKKEHSYGSRWENPRRAR